MSHASVCVLSYERPELLRQTLGTLWLAGAPFELIVHDDGSRNVALRRYLQELVDAGFISTLIVNPPGHNQGVGTAINRMFSLASGDPLIKVDQDLVFHGDWLLRVNQALEANRDRQRNGERPIGMLGLLHYHHEPVDYARTMIAHHGTYSVHTHVLGSAFALTRAAWEDFGPFNEHSEAFAEDWQMMKRIDGSGYCNALPPESLCTNVGMGYGPSTVNVEPGRVQAIQHGPVIYTP